MLDILQEQTQQELPTHQLGFRRLLAGIYSHTSAHIVAAPMAHYMAKNKSRFQYSHDTCYMSVYAIESLIKNSDMQMSFRTVNKKQVGFSSAMNYFYRPIEMEHYCMYRFYSKMKFISRTEAKQTGQEYFEFTKSHPLHQISVAVYRDRLCVPVFPWNWLGSTKGFTTPLTEEIVDDSNLDFKQKEEYTYKFMILFMPFRQESDFMIEGSHQRMWRSALDHGEISDSMIKIANNIQMIQNSLDSSLSPDFLKINGLEEIDGMDEEMDGQEDKPEHMLQTIAELFTSTFGKSKMTQDVNRIDPIFCGKILESNFVPENQGASVPNLILRDVFCFSDENTESPIPVEEKHNKIRFQTSIEQLNALALFQQVLTESTDDTTTEATVKATGTCESIELWGLRAKLDLQQLTAFEIIVANYVLSFYEEAKSGNEWRYDNAEFLNEKSRLCVLARRAEHSNKPLRMFVTGGGGAGKCKFLSSISISRIFF